MQPMCTFNDNLLYLTWGLGTMKTKYRFGSLKKLLCPGNDNTNLIADFRHIIEMLKKADEAVGTPHPLSGNVATMPQNLVLRLAAADLSHRQETWLGDLCGASSSSYRRKNCTWGAALGRGGQDGRRLTSCKCAPVLSPFCSSPVFYAHFFCW